MIIFRLTPTEPFKDRTLNACDYSSVTFYLCKNVWPSRRARSEYLQGEVVVSEVTVLFQSLVTDLALKVAVPALCKARGEAHSALNRWSLYQLDVCALYHRQAPSCDFSMEGRETYTGQRLVCVNVVHIISGVRLDWVSLMGLQV